VAGPAVQLELIFVTALDLSRARCTHSEPFVFSGGVPPDGSGMQGRLNGAHGAARGAAPVARAGGPGAVPERRPDGAWRRACSAAGHAAGGLRIRVDCAGEIWCVYNLHECVQYCNLDAISFHRFRRSAMKFAFGGQQWKSHS